MSYEHKEGSGALFKNERKATPSQPDYTGDCLINGKPMRIAAWIKDGKKGKFMSLNIQPKEDKPQEYPKAPAGRFTPDEQIPF